MERFDVPARLFLASVFCALIASTSTASWIRSIGALPLVLYLPGRCLMAAAFPHNRAGGELQVLSAALSLALVALLGVLLASVHALAPTVWLRTLVILCAVLCFASAFGLARSEGQAQETPQRARLGLLRPLAVAIAVGLAGFAYSEASRGALAQKPDLYTDFWMVPAGASGPAFATVGVRNQEGREASYSIAVIGRGALLERIPPFTLRAGEERTLRVALPSVQFRNGAVAEQPASDASSPLGVDRAHRLNIAELRVEARLFKDNEDAAYRRVWVAVPAPRKENEAIADGHEASAAGQLGVQGNIAETLRTTIIPSRAVAAAATVPASKFDATRATDAIRVNAVPMPGSATVAGDMRADLADVAQSFQSPAFASRNRPSEPSPTPPLE